ncbi:hypothetical protein ABAC402_15470 [Asticcacaulis sp. AC402]|nr:hypothetical protein ABAC402_15470 [Asticcacaulis sp. AC402]
MAIAAGASPVGAAPPAPVPAAASAKPWICPQLDHADAYTNEGYRFIRQGKGEWLFRTGTDLTLMAPLSAANIDNFARLRKRLADSGTRLVISVSPPRGAIMRQFIDPIGLRGEPFSADAAMSTYFTMVKRLRGVGIMAPDTILAANNPAFTLEGTPREFYLSGDLHWTAYGAFVTAKALKQEMAKNPEFASLPPGQFATSLVAPKLTVQTIREEAYKICKVPYNGEMRVFYDTVAEAADDAGGLLGDGGLLDDAGVEVALVGTSFSVVEYANFSGFLRQELGTEVANYGIAGGGLSASILSYMLSEDYAQAKPKFLIWEMQYHNLKEVDALPLIMGAADGDCGAKALIAGKETPVKLGQTTAFTVRSGDRHRIKGPANAVLDFGDSDARRYHLYLTYTDGTKARFDVDATRWSHPANKIIVRVPRDGADLASISLVPDQRLSGNVSARICRASL